MKNPFRRKHMLEDKLVFLLFGLLGDHESDLRRLFARVARSESRDFFALHIGTELEKFERELQRRAECVLANLGSAAPTLEQHARQAFVDKYEEKLK